MVEYSWLSPRRRNPSRLFFEVMPFRFEMGFIHDHAGSIMTQVKLAILGLISDAYDAGTPGVELGWPCKHGDELAVEDNGFGMSAEECSVNEAWHFGLIQEKRDGTS